MVATYIPYLAYIKHDIIRAYVDTIGAYVSSFVVY